MPANSGAFSIKQFIYGSKAYFSLKLIGSNWLAVVTPQPGAAAAAAVVAVWGLKKPDRLILLGFLDYKEGGLGYGGKENTSLDCLELQGEVSY